MTRDEVNDLLSAKAWKLGVAYGKAHNFDAVSAKNRADSKEMSRDADMLGCPSRFFDIFKYGAQSAWRRKGELEGMLAKDLEPGDIFIVIGHTDPESPVRVCIANDDENGLRFGFPNQPGYWGYMGKLCRVGLRSKEE